MSAPVDAWTLRALRFAIYHARIATPEHGDRLPIGARAKAARLGYRGAFCAWISGDDGAELCPDRFFREEVTGREVRKHGNDWQIHVAPDVAVTVTADAVTVRADDANRAAVPVRAADRRFELPPAEVRREVRTPPGRAG